jgi:GNAT superfamily N-acetyltransferase
MYYLRALLNPAASLSRHWQYGRYGEEIINAGEKDAYDESWSIIEIAVAPEFQRKGFGAALLQWGVNKACEERVPILLSATEAGRGFYLTAGFREYGYWQWGPRDRDHFALMRFDL